MSKHIKLNLNDKKEFNKGLKAINRFQYMGGVSNQKVGGFLYEICRFIAEKSAEGYKNAKYNGKINVAKVGEHMFYPNADVYATWKAIHDEKRTKFDETAYLHYKVVVGGRLCQILEFGAGSRFKSEGYASKAGATAWSNSPKRDTHFISNLTGLETWVYKGEQGNNPYVEDGGHTHRDHDKYYSAGNEPCRALFKAVEYVKVNYAEFYKQARLYRSGRKAV